MNWKAATLEELRQNATVEEVPGQESQYLVTVATRENKVLRTLVRLDSVSETIHYMNGHPHTLNTIAELISSMSKHLKAM